MAAIAVLQLPLLDILAYRPVEAEHFIIDLYRGLNLAGAISLCQKKKIVSSFMQDMYVCEKTLSLTQIIKEFCNQRSAVGISKIIGNQ